MQGKPFKVSFEDWQVPSQASKPKIRDWRLGKSIVVMNTSFIIPSIVNSSKKSNAYIPNVIVSNDGKPKIINQFIQ